MSGWTRFVRSGWIVGWLLGDGSGDWAAVWASVSLLGFSGRFRCLRRQRCSEDLFSKAMRPRKDVDAELCIGAGLFGTEFVFGEVAPTWGNTKTVGTVVVSSCSTTRGLFRNRGIFLGLIRSRYKVVFVISIWAGGSLAELEIGPDPPGIGELSLDGGSKSDVRMVGAR